MKYLIIAMLGYDNDYESHPPTGTGYAELFTFIGVWHEYDR